MNTFPFLILSKMLVIWAIIHKMLGRQANREVPDQTASASDLGLLCLSRPFAIGWQIVFKILKHSYHRHLIFMPPKELWEAYSNRTVRTSVPLCVRCISPILFEVGIPNLVCGYILGWQSVPDHFQVTVTLTLTSDLVFIVITMSVRLSRFRVRCISPIFFEIGIPNLMCGCILGWRSVAYHFLVTVTLTLTSDLVFRIIVSGAYLLYYLR